jgi:hypothetical protein
VQGDIFTVGDPFVSTFWAGTPATFIGRRVQA